MNFCTLFDSYYVHKGIALYLSLERVTHDFHLYVMAFDRDCFNKLKSCGFRHMTVELSDDFETPELLAVKPYRTKAEYCWTCGPSVTYHFITKYCLDEITYLDSDLYFLTDPHVVKEEVGDKSVAISEQHLGNEKASRYGKYCVQYITFKNDKDGIGALTWWRDRCIEWCYSRYEDGKYGDQKYLEQFEVLFNNVYVIQNRGLLGTWDINLYTLKDTSLIYDGKEYPFVFFHMSGTIFSLKERTLSMKADEFVITPEMSRLFFTPYTELMKLIFVKYFNKTVDKISVKGRSPFYVWLLSLRGRFRNNKLAIFIYYKLLGKKYNGRGEKKLV